MELILVKISRSLLILFLVLMWLWFERLQHKSSIRKKYPLKKNIQFSKFLVSFALIVGLLDLGREMYYFSKRHKSTLEMQQKVKTFMLDSQEKERKSIVLSQEISQLKEGMKRKERLIRDFGIKVSFSFRHKTKKRFKNEQPEYMSRPIVILKYGKSELIPLYARGKQIEFKKQNDNPDYTEFSTTAFLPTDSWPINEKIESLKKITGIKILIPFDNYDRYHDIEFVKYDEMRVQLIVNGRSLPRLRQKDNDKPLQILDGKPFAYGFWAKCDFGITKPMAEQMLNRYVSLISKSNSSSVDES